MLILTRKAGESIQVGKDVSVTVTKIDGSQVKLGFDAPRKINIRRSEIKPLENKQNNRLPLSLVLLGGALILRKVWFKYGK